jgi:signal transduction histidine kinase
MPFFRRLALRRKIILIVLAILAAHSVLGFLALHGILSKLVLTGEPGWLRLAAIVEIIYLVVLGALTVMAGLVTRRVIGRLTRPVVELTHLADEISIGNLEVEFRFGRHVKCWELKDCRETSCPAYGSTAVQCWYVDGTPCKGVEPRFPQKLIQCRTCEVYQAHRGDEIVQLADAFQHMTKRLVDYQAELLRAERLAATGETVAMVSHSIKNILDSLMGGIYVYRRGRRLNDETSKATGWDMVERNLGAISELVRNLLDFSKARQPFLEPCDPARMVADVVQLHKERADAAKVDLRARCGDALGRVYLDVHAVFHSLVNLVTNALDALPPDRPGRVELAVSRDGDRLVFSVSDDGTGMSPEVQVRLFKGMFSTKGSKGTGLGLLSVQKVVREHGGALEVASEQGKGATFRIALPLVTAPSDAELAAKG